MNSAGAHFFLFVIMISVVLLRNHVRAHRLLQRLVRHVRPIAGTPQPKPPRHLDSTPHLRVQKP